MPTPARYRSMIATKKWLFFYILLTGFILMVHLRLQDYAFDDAYIHFRIAKNYLQYGVPYYNPSEMVLATSSTGWTLFLTLLFIIGTKPVYVSIINSIATTVGAVVFSRTISKSRDWILYAVLYIALLLPSSIGLMETSFTLLLLSLAYCAYKNNKPISLLIFGILPFFRLEYVLVSGLFAISAVITKKFKLKKIIIYPILTAIPFLVFDLIYFNTIIPNTVSAKLIGYDLTIFETFALIMTSFVPGLNSTNIYFWIIAVPLIIYAALRCRTCTGMEEKILILAGALIVSVFLVARVYSFVWYGPLFTIPLIIPAAYKFLRDRRIGNMIALVVMAIPILLSLVKNVYASIFDEHAYELYPIEVRVPLYIEIGQELFQAYPDAVLMSSEIGGLGWGFNGYIFDAFGLASPEAIQHHQKLAIKNGGIPLSLIEEKKPELIVSHAKYIKDFMASEIAVEYEKKAYQVVLYEDHGYSSIIEILVYIRKDIGKTSQ